MPGTLRVLKEQKKAKLLQYGERVFGITQGSENERADKAIEKTEDFYRSLGLSTRLSEVNIGDDTIKIIEERFSKRGYFWAKIIMWIRKLFAKFWKVASESSDTIPLLTSHNINHLFHAML